MWRQFHREFKGTGELIDARGMKLLKDFPECRSLDHSSTHIDQWSQLVGQNGQKLVQLVPEQLRTNLLAIIPDELENEMDQPLNAHVKTYKQTIEW